MRFVFDVEGAHLWDGVVRLADPGPGWPGRLDDPTRPGCSKRLDYEAELAVTIGATARHLTPDNALSQDARTTLRRL